MKIGKQNYPKYADAHAPRSPLLKNCLCAFLVGGLVCAAAGALTDLWRALGADERDAGLITSVVLIFVSVLLTALDVFDSIAKAAGAGTFLPVTGFANAVASSAIDARDEGLVLGVGAKVFTVAGPVLLYGTLAGTVWGLIYALLSR